MEKNNKKSENEVLTEDKSDFMKRWQEEFGSFEGSTRVSMEDFMDEMKRMMEFE